MSTDTAVVTRFEVGMRTRTDLRRDVSWTPRTRHTTARDSLVFDQQMERIDLWIQDWEHEQRCSILRAMVTWGRHGQIQFLRTASLPALHRDFMYSARSQFPDKQFVPISTFYSRKLKNRQILLAHRKDNKDYHRISSAHLHHQDELAHYVDELKLPHISASLSRDHTWDRESMVESSKSRWGVQPIGTPQPDTDSMGPTEWPLESLSEKMQGWSLGSPRTRTRHRDQEPERTYSVRAGNKTPLTNNQAGKEGLRRSVTWSSLKARSRDNNHPMRTAHSSKAALSRHSANTTTKDDDGTEPDHFNPNNFEEEETNLSFFSSPSGLPDENQRIPANDLPALSPSHTRASLSQLSFKKRKRQRDALRRSNTDLSSDMKSSNMSIEPDCEQTKVPSVSVEGAQVIQWYLTQWNDTQRNEFLRRFLLKLDPRQHYFVSSILAVRSRMDLLSYLPEVVSSKILSYLTSRQLAKASLVCKRWHKLCNSNRVWKTKCSQIQLAIPVLSSKPDWKKLYQDNKNIKANWDQGRCKVVDCKGHTDRVLSVTFDERRMATGSVDKLIRIWNLDTGRCIQTLKGHMRGVWCLRFFSKNLLLSGSYDCSIKVWNLREGSCVRTMLGHEGPVWAIVWRGSKLASASHDKTARIWDVGRCYLSHTLTGHKGAVYCIDMDEKGDICFTGSSDKTVRLWDTTTGTQLLMIRVSDRSAIMSVSYSHNVLACSYWDSIAIYRINSKLTAAKCIQKYEEHYKRIECLELKVDPVKGSGTLISGGKDGILKYWDITKDHSVQTYRGHNRTINCVHCDAFRIATASYDNKIKIWDFRS